MKRSAIAAVGVVPLLLLSACGSGSSSSADETTGPIKIIQIVPTQSQITSLPYMQTSIQAAVDELNGAGGIGGRKVEVTTCNSQYDPNKELSCAQTAIQQGAVAAVGSLLMNGAQTLAVLEKAHVASVGADAITPADGQSPASFLFDPGLPGYAAMPEVAKEKFGATKIATFNSDNPSAPTNNKYFEEGAKLAGVQIVSNVVIPTDAVDVTTYVKKAEDAGAQAIVTPMEPEMQLRVYRALEATGSHMKVVLSASAVTPDLIKQAGTIMNGDYLVQGTPNAADDNQWGKAYVAAMKKYEPKETVFSGVGLRAYYAVKLLAQVMEQDGSPVTRENVWKAFNKVSGMKFAWANDLDFTKAGPLKDYPRVVTSTMFLMQIKDGNYVAQGTLNPF